MQKGNNVYFHHIAKTGGTAIATRLYKDGLIKKDPTQFTSILHSPYLLQKSKRQFSFTVVRNPFDRLVSAYYWTTYSEWYDDVYKNIMRENYIQPDIKFEEWFDLALNKKMPEDVRIRKVHSQYRNGNKSETFLKRKLTYELKNMMDNLRRAHTSVQFDSFGVKTESGISEPSLDNIDYIIKFEDMENGWKHVAEKIGATPTLERVRVSSNRGDYRKYFTEEMKQRTFEYFKNDFENFNYDW